ncbi:hypothetical protein MMC26_000567 [Xylographa opegraphella]|nr:hypothetical protein [Xylographa opegraphella]
MPAYNPIFGHLLICGKILANLPTDANPHYLPDQTRLAVPGLGPIYYLDNWPFSAPILVTASPSTAYQIAQEHSLPKFHAMRKFLRPLTGEYDLVTMEGQLWKTWRAIYNPGFSLTHLMTLVPQIVKETAVFCEILQQHAEAKDLFEMKTLTDNLTMDIIGKVVLDSNINSQQSENVMVTALRRQIPWLSFGAEINPIKRFNPLRPLVHWYNASQMDRYISLELEDRFSHLQTSGKSYLFKESKSIADLTLNTYLADKTPEAIAAGMDANFKSFAISQIKLFIFSGHDTTSSTMSYVFYLLGKHPTALQRLRNEHDNVFGVGTPLGSVICDKPHLLNQLPFTTAVIKETLRLFPVVSSTRAGEPGYSVVDEQGRFFPTDGCLVWSIHHALHRDPAFWPQPDAFVPERWLAEPTDPLYPIKGAWRPFKFGPRNCIGQELAVLEIKIVVLMALRRFDVEAAYEEWDLLAGRKGRRTVNGERAYQVLLAQPSDGLPCRVKAVQR